MFFVSYNITKVKVATEPISNQIFTNRKGEQTVETIRCPICNNRLFDCSDLGAVKIEIKCNKCKNIIKIEQEKSK